MAWDDTLTHLNSLTQKDREAFGEAITALLKQGFIYQRYSEKERQLYQTIVRLEMPIREWLALAHWELEHHPDYEVFQVVHQDRDHERPFSYDETRLLLVLRLMQLERDEQHPRRKAQALRVEATTFRGRYLKYFEERLSDAALERRFSVFRRYRLVGWDAATQTIDILPTLAVALPAGRLPDILALVEAYQPGAPTRRARSAGAGPTVSAGTVPAENAAGENSTGGVKHDGPDGVETKFPVDGHLAP